jgi:hypothetical protein
MNILRRPWIVADLSFGINAFMGKPKSAANALLALKVTASKFGFDLLKKTSCSTQDCTGSSFNVMKNVPGVLRTQCFAHRANTHLENGFKTCKKLNEVFYAIEQMQIMIGNSTLRLEMLDKEYKEYCTISKIPYKKKGFVKPSTTRWNERQKVADRYLVLRPAILKLDPVAMFTSGSTEEKRKQISNFKRFRSTVEANLILLESVLPYMRTTACWVQVLSAKNWFTSSLVLVATLEMKKALSEIDSASTKLKSSLEVEKVSAGNTVAAAAAALRRQFDRYLGLEFLHQSAALCSSLLDPTVIQLLSLSEIDAAELKLEKILSDVPSLTQTGARSRGPPRVLTETEMQMFGAAARRLITEEAREGNLLQRADSRVRFGCILRVLHLLKSRT